MAKAIRLNSGSWRVQVYAGKDENGKRIMKSFTGSTRREAEHMSDDYLSKQKGHKVSDLTLEEGVKKYINNITNVDASSTIRGYNTIFKCYLGNMKCVKIKNITQEMIQSYINDCAKKYSPKTCRNIHGLIASR